MSWWAEAGVEHSFRHDAEGWLARDAESTGTDVQSPVNIATSAHSIGSTAARQPTASSPSAARLGGDPNTWPDELTALTNWWMTEPSLGEPGAYPRVPPIGSVGASIMLLVPMPEEADREELLSGPAGRMARLLLRAMGQASDSAYLASVLPRHTPLADWNGLVSRGLADIVRHHISLAKPERVLVLGRGIAGLFEPDQKVFLGPGLDELQRSAQRRQRFWRSWLEWTGS